MPDLTSKLKLKKPFGYETVSRVSYNENLDLLDKNAAAQTQVDEPFFLKSTVYNANGGPSIDLTFGPGRVRFLEGFIDKSTDSTTSIMIPGINTNYWIFIKNDGTYTYNTDGSPIYGALMIWKISTGNPASNITVSDKRGQLPGAGALAAINGVPVGTVLPYFGQNPPSGGWLLSDGKTIGDSSSGATSRAHADIQTLFELLWNSLANTELPIQNSDGTAGTRGTSATVDFNAHKRLPLPDLRGRFLLGRDNMGSQSANRVTYPAANVMGGSGGAEKVTLTTNQIPAHTHPASLDSVNTTSSGSHEHYIKGTSYVQYGKQEGLDVITYGSSLKAYSNWTESAGAHTHTVSGNVTVSNNNTTGSSHENIPPYLAVNHIIKY